MGWSVVPEGLRGVLVYIQRTYNPPGGIVVTENGLAATEPDLDAAMNDTSRISFYRGYIGAVRDALDDGVDVRGYFLWSFMDNFEWACKYAGSLFAAQELCYGLLGTAPLASLLV
jgi:beta-glucosidase/6-phospho-beta-glucosidase/beta-galactosidase